jgi:hypothetical protein
MKALLVFLAALTLSAQVKITTGSDRILIDINGAPFTSLFIGSETTKPYLHPLRTASGKSITRAFPMDIVEGEERDHPHHRGAWLGLGDINGFDFWMNEETQKSTNKGRQILKRILDVKGGKKSGYATCAFDWVDPNGTVLMNEVRTYTFYAQPDSVRMFDMETRLTATQKVKLGDTKEGWFAIRLTTSMDEKHGGKLRNSEGKQGMEQVWGSRAPWAEYVGNVQGEQVGIAIFDHPTNPKHPTYWHARDYGLFAANPFGEHDFLKDPARNGSMSLEPGQNLRFRYRVTIYPPAVSSELGAMYQKYSAMK